MSDIKQLIKIDKWTVISPDAVLLAHRVGGYTEIWFKEHRHHRKYGGFQSIWDSEAEVWQRIVEATGARP